MPMSPAEFKNARLALNLTASLLARCLEMDLRTIYRYERAEIPVPRPVALLLSLALKQEAVRTALFAPLAGPPPRPPALSRRARLRQALLSPADAPASTDSGA